MNVFYQEYLQKYQTIYQASNDAVHLSALNASSDHEPKNNTTVQQFKDQSLLWLHFIQRKIA